MSSESIYERFKRNKSLNQNSKLRKDRTERILPHYYQGGASDDYDPYSNHIKPKSYLKKGGGKIA